MEDAHHVIPSGAGGGLGGVASTGQGGAAGAGAGVHGGSSGVVSLAGGGGGGGAWLFGLVVAAIVAVALFYVYYRWGVSPRARGAGEGGGGRAWLTGLYRYEGARRLLRGLFLRFRGVAEARAGRGMPWATAREAATVIGEGWAVEWAVVYGRAMYGPVEPGPEVVAELEGRLRREGV